MTIDNSIHQQNGNNSKFRQYYPTTTMVKIKEINISYYVFNTPDLLASLDSIRNNNAQKEYYITDVPKILLDAGKKILALPVLKEIECLGVNTQADVAEVEKALQANAQR